LRDNGIDISDSAVKELKGRSRPSFDVTHDYVPIKKEMRQILSFADTKERALFLTSISSGMRIGEIIELLPTDINWETNPVKISIRGAIAKNGHARITFISNEARDALKAWLEIRDSYLKTAVKRCDGNGIAKKDANDKRVFPVSYQVPYFWWRRLIKCAGFDEKDSVSGRYKVHIHCLRKFLRTNLPVGGMSVDAVETILGHTGYLTREYRRIDENELAKQYVKAMFKVTISDTSDEITDEEKHIEEQVKQRLEDRISEIERNLENRIIRKLMDNFSGRDIQSDKTFQEMLHSMS
jgi:integrase